MSKLYSIIKTKYESNKRLLAFCFTATFLIGLFAHGYMYLQDSFSHDSLHEFYANHEWKVQLGRFFAPVYCFLLRGDLALPWLIGVYSLIWISGSVFLTIKIFDIKSKASILLTSGVFATNITVTATTATYIHDLDTYMFALLLSVLAVFVWKRYTAGFLCAAVCVALSLALHQSYISVTVTLVLLVLITDLLNGKRLFAVFVDGSKAAVGLIAGGVLYWLTMKLVFFVTKIPQLTGTYNSLDKITTMTLEQITESAKNAYITSVDALKAPLSTTHIAKLLPTVLIIVFVSCIILRLINRSVGIAEKAVAVVFVLILPFAMNLSGFLSGMSHDMMQFAVWLGYLLLLLLTKPQSNSCADNKGKRVCIEGLYTPLRTICLAAVFLIIINNVILSNEVYVKKDLEQDANLSLFTRVLYDMESVEEYNASKMQVAFIGKPSNFDKPMYLFEDGLNLTGARSGYVIGTEDQSRFGEYFLYKLHYRIIPIDNSDYKAIRAKEEVKAMPCYPESGSVAVVDGVLIVKFDD